MILVAINVVFDPHWEVDMWGRGQCDGPNFLVYRMQAAMPTGAEDRVARGLRQHGSFIGGKGGDDVVGLCVEPGLEP